MNSWGYHLILDCKGSAMSKEIVKDAKFIKEFTKILVDGIEMKAYGEPIIEHFATHEEKASGFSLVQLKHLQSQVIFVISMVIFI